MPLLDLRRASGSPSRPEPAPGGVTVIVPALDEADRIEECLATVARQPVVEEAIVVDGGSRDGTLDAVGRARPLLEAAGIPLRWTLAGRGRAIQMNAGAAAARGRVLLFLHADTLLPEGGAAAALRAVEAGAAGGAFRHAFVERRPGLAAISLHVNARSLLTRCYFGDQAIFARRDVFEALGGFPSLPIMEDVAFCRLLRRAGPTRLVSPAVRTSARRFLSRGALRTGIRMFLLRTAWRLGTDPVSLERRYREAP